MSYRSESVAVVVGLLVMAIVVSRQLFLFAVFRDPQGFLDSQGGSYRLWLAIIAAVIACIAGALMFHFFGRHDRSELSQAQQAPLGPAIANSDYPAANSPAPAPFDAIRWAQLNPWLLEGEADDRKPMIGSVADGSGTPSARRAFARRSHQVNYKEWSKARHD